MSNPINAFNFVIQSAGRDVVLERNHATETGTIKMARSNYFRDLAAIEETTIEGREFVITKDSFDRTTFAVKKPEKGDRINDATYGKHTISEVRPMEVMGTLVGWRIRTS